MGRSSKAKDEAADNGFVELVSPSGHRSETPRNALRDSQLRFDGYLPAEQAALEAPEVTDSGSSGLAGSEQTAGSNGS
jgi:hypothetical protein